MRQPPAVGLNRGPARFPAFLLAAALAVASALPASGAPSFGSLGSGKTPRRTFRTGPDRVSRLMVKFRDPSLREAPSLGRSRLRSLAAAAGTKGLEHARAMPGGLHLLRLPKGVTEAEAWKAARALERDPSVEYAVPDRRAYPAYAPNDPGVYLAQWDLYHPNDVPGGANLFGAWDITTGDASIVMAVLDTGITAHTELDGRKVAGRDMISQDQDFDGSGLGTFYVANDGNGRDSNPADPGDFITAGEHDGSEAGGYLAGCGGCFSPGDGSCPSSWHGTHVAGIMGAEADNNEGIAGMNWVSKILPVRVLGKCGGFESDIVDAIRWAAGQTVDGVANPNPARVINMSLSGLGNCTAPMQSAIDYAIAGGAAVVTAAGNETGAAHSYYPGNCAGVINVAATGIEGEKASYTNTGFTVDLAAPGGNFDSGYGVWSTLNDGTTTPGTEDYAEYQGTSMAAPHVTGIAALMLSANPKHGPATIESLLKTSARDFPTGTGYGDCGAECGAGLVDAGAAVRAAAAPGPSANLAVKTLSTSQIEYSWTGDPGSTIDTFHFFDANDETYYGASSVSPATFFGAPVNTVLSIRIHGERLGVLGAGTVFQSTSTLSNPVAFGTITPATDSIQVAHPACAPLSSCSGYVLIASTASDFTGVHYSVQSLDASNTSLTVTGLTPSTPYYLALGSLNQMGGPNYTYNPGTVVTVTDYFAPIVTDVSEVGLTSLRLNWVGAGNANGTTYQAQSALDAGFSSGLITITGPAPNNFTALFTGLTPNTNRYFRVRALPGGPYGTFGPSATLAQTPSTAAAPFTGLGASGLTVNWGAGASPSNPGATQHETQLSPVSDFSAGVLTDIGAGFSASFGSLSSNTRYHARVRALGEGGDQTPFVLLGSTYTHAQTPVNIAEPFAAQTQAGFTVSFGPNGNPGGTAYQWQLAENGGFAPLLGSGVTDSTSLLFSGLKGNQSHHLRFASLNAVGARSAFSATVTTVTMPYPPTAASPVGSNQTVSGLRMHWTAGNNDASSLYTAQVSADPLFGSGVFSVGAGPSTFADFAGLSPGTRYHLRVKTLPLGAPGNPDSGFASLGSRSTLAAAPTPNPPSLVMVTYTSATVRWTASASAQGYRLQASTEPAFAGKLFTSEVPVGASAQGAVAGLAYNTLYHLRVGAVNPDGVANYLGLGTATTLLPNLSVATMTPSGLLLTLVPTFPPLSPITLIRVWIPPGTFPVGTPITLNSSVEYDWTAARTNQAATADLGVPGVGFFLSASGLQPSGEVAAYLVYDPLLLPPGTDPKSVTLARYDDGAAQWSLLPTTVDTSQNTVIASIGHFSLFSPFFVAAGQDLSAIQIFPIPWEIGSDNPLFNAARLTIANLPAGARVRVMNLSGELLWEDNAGPNGVLTWDGLNRFGRRAGSGTYLAVIEGAGQREVRRIVLVR